MATGALFFIYKYGKRTALCYKNSLINFQSFEILKYIDQHNNTVSVYD